MATMQAVVYYSYLVNCQKEFGHKRSSFVRAMALDGQELVKDDWAPSLERDFFAEVCFRANDAWRGNGEEWRRGSSIYGG